MKRIIILNLITLFSCQTLEESKDCNINIKKIEKNTSLISDKLKGKVKSVKQTVTEYTKKSHINSYLKEYNKFGNQIKFENYGKFWFTRRYTYDQLNNCVLFTEKSYYIKEGEEKIIYNYENNNKMKEVSIDANNQMKYKIINIYDNRNNNIEHIKINGNDTNKTIKDYDKCNNLINEKVLYLNSLNIDKETKYLDNIKTETIHYNTIGEIEKVIHYDKHGNKIKISTYTNNKLVNIKDFSSLYKYNDSGQRRNSKLYDENGLLTKQYIFKYYPNDTLEMKSYVIYDFDGNISFSEKTNFNTNGKVTNFIRRQNKDEFEEKIYLRNNEGKVIELRERNYLEPQTYAIFKYDIYGEQISFLIEEGEYSEVISSTSIQYDKYNNWVRKTTSDKTGVSYEIKRDIKYF